MTSAAVCAKFSIVHVIGPVAIAAAAVSRFHLGERAAMALLAGNIDVSAGQWKVSLQVMIESPLFPGDRGVAGAAFIVEIAVVRVVFRMARNTGGFGFSECLGLVAVRALCNLVVRAQQRKRSQIVIEEHRVLPIDFRVAVLTLRAQRLIVGVVIQVTRVTSRFQLNVEYGFNVTIVADNHFVAAE